MSLKKLLGISDKNITDIEIAEKIKEAQKKELDFIELNIDGDIIKISLPHIAFDPDSDIGN